MQHSAGTDQVFPPGKISGAPWVRLVPIETGVFCVCFVQFSPSKPAELTEHSLTRRELTESFTDLRTH